MLTKVPLDGPSNIVLKRIFKNKEYKHPTQKMMQIFFFSVAYKKCLLYLQLKNISSNVWCVMGSPTTPVLANVFMRYMIKIEKSLLLSLTEYITYWNRYLADAIYFVKVNTIN